MVNRWAYRWRNNSAPAASKCQPSFFVLCSWAISCTTVSGITWMVASGNLFRIACTIFCVSRSIYSGLCPSVSRYVPDMTTNVLHRFGNLARSKTGIILSDPATGTPIFMQGHGDIHTVQSPMRQISRRVTAASSVSNTSRGIFSFG